MNNQKKHILIWGAVFVVLIAVFNLLQGEIGTKNVVALSDFLYKVSEKQVSSVKIQGRSIEGIFNDGTAFFTYLTDYPSLIDKLIANAVHVEVMPIETRASSFFNFLIYLSPTLLFLGVWIFFARQAQGGKAFGFGKSKAKLLSNKSQKITFKDVAGVDEAKAELTEVVHFLRDPSKFQKVGGQIPKGCLLIGPPGSGKTLLARAIAGEANVPFFSISGSDFVEMFVGVGASRVRDMFEQGKRSAPCIIFVDEIDAVGRHRGASLSGGHEEREQTLNQLLVEMDGFEANEGVIIIAATNRPDVLDQALLRPGRFDRQIVVPMPDIKGREQILNVHLKKVKYSSKIDTKIIARGTAGFSGAELANLVNESALIAARYNKKEVEMDDLEEAKDKILMGVERRSMAMSDEQKKLTAYHEAGHALVGIHCPGSDPIHKATIIPRGRALGMVVRLPEDDNLSRTKEQLQALISTAMAGRVAEEIIFGKEKITTGASSDIQQATRLAKNMVSECGLSDKVGPIYYGQDDDPYYARNTKSEKTAELIDLEVKKIIDDGYKFAKNILMKHIDQLHLLANTLIEQETLSGDQIKNLLAKGSTKKLTKSKKTP